MRRLPIPCQPAASRLLLLPARPGLLRSRPLRSACSSGPTPMPSGVSSRLTPSAVSGVAAGVGAVGRGGGVQQLLLF